MEKMVEELQRVLNQAVASGEECGCQLTVYRHGKLICDLTAGYTDESHKTPMKTTSLVPIFSVGKGILTTLFHRFAERGVIGYDDLVADCWPEFAANGKSGMKVWHLLTHRAGLYAFPEDYAFTDWFNWEKAAATLAAMAPLSEIGGKHCYHAHTFGILAGHLLERVTKRPLNELLREEILSPLGIKDLFFGVPDARWCDLAPIVADKDPADMRIGFNAREVLQGLNPSSNGMANAHSLARIYAALLPGGVDGVSLLKPETLENALLLRRSADDPAGTEWDKFGLGYALCGPAAPWNRMFGHGGACGSEGFADFESGYAVGFTKNKLNATHPLHPTRNAISDVLGIPHRIW